MVGVKALVNTVRRVMMSRELMSRSRRGRWLEDAIREEHIDDIADPTLRAAKGLNRGVRFHGAIGDPEATNQHAKPVQVMGGNRPDKPTVKDHGQLLDGSDSVVHCDHHGLGETEEMENIEEEPNSWLRTGRDEELVVAAGGLHLKDLEESRFRFRQRDGSRWSRQGRRRGESW